MPPLKDIWAGDPAVIRQVLEQLRTSYPDYAWIGYATPDGTVHAATQGMLEGQSVRERPWFQDGLKGPAVGDVHEAKLLATLLGPAPNNEPFRFVDVAAPVRDETGRVIGVVGAHLSWAWAEERRRAVLGSQSLSGGKSLWILSGDGTMLLGPDIGSKPFSDERVRAMRQATAGAFEDPVGRGAHAHRRGFALLADEAFGLHRRHGHSLAVLLLDIDFFKAVNDTYGHAAGDVVIQAIGTALNGTLRATDKIARFGGEEFIVLIHEVDETGIITVAQNLRRAVEALAIPYQDRTLSVTVSVGGALARPDDRDIQDVIERADDALYKAKAAGRNRVTIDGLQIQLASAVA